MKTKIFLLLFALLVTLFAGCASEKESGSSPIPETSSDLISSSGSLSAAALLRAVYGGYYLATLLSCRRMALSAAHRQRQE